tara:strand:+ start:30120 stop:30326 length:207 start_codon:yes stop_codon:yes gene_type:complete
MIEFIHCYLFLHIAGKNLVDRQSDGTNPLNACKLSHIEIGKRSILRNRLLHRLFSGYSGERGYPKREY